MNNRILKFRVYDNKNKRFLLPYPFLDVRAVNSFEGEKHIDSFLLCGNGELAFNLKFYCAANKEENQIRYSILQFTGLLDANNKEIFEGDIVKTDPKHMASALGLVPNYTKGYIDWVNESWKVCQSKIGATHLGDFATCHCCNCGLEIIGNIFENPEILEQNNEQ